VPSKNIFYHRNKPLARDYHRTPVTALISYLLTEAGGKLVRGFENVTEKAIIRQVI